jgi:hypothetical protein
MAKDPTGNKDFYFAFPDLNKKTFWGPILEKAFAKSSGAFSNIYGGYI